MKCACSDHDLPKRGRKIMSLVIQLARGISQWHHRDWCAQFIRGSSPEENLSDGRAFQWNSGKLREQIMMRLDMEQING